MSHSFPSYREYQAYLQEHQVHTQSSSFAGPTVVVYTLGAILLLWLGYFLLIFLEEHGIDPLWDILGWNIQNAFGGFFGLTVFLFIVAGIGSALSKADRPQKDEQIDHNLQTLADFLHLQVDECPPCSLQVLSKTLPYLSHTVLKVLFR